MTKRMSSLLGMVVFAVAVSAAWVIEGSSVPFDTIVTLASPR